MVTLESLRRPHPSYVGLHRRWGPGLSTPSYVWGDGAQSQKVDGTGGRDSMRGLFPLGGIPWTRLKVPFNRPLSDPENLDQVRTKP